MINRSLIVFLLILAALKTSAQGGSSNLEFTENKGQWDSRVKFKADFGGGAFFLQKNGFTVLLHNPDDLMRMRQAHNGRRIKILTKQNKQTRNSEDSSLLVRSHAYRVAFVGANENPEIVPDKPLPTYENYFIGNDHSKWAGHCNVYQGITYKNVYPNIDLRYYTNNGILKYDLIVRPGGNAEDIIMKYEGVDKLSIKNDELQIKTSVGTPKELAPTSYQIDNNGRKEVECNFFQSSSNTIRFRIKNYSHQAALVIDPTVIFATFTGSKIDNWGFTATYGPDGSAFSGGIVAGNGFPVSSGAFKEPYDGGKWDIGIMKLDPTGRNRLYATYLGGSADEYPHSLVVNPQGNLIVFGRTRSFDFPITKLIGPGGNTDIFVTEFNSTGTGIVGSLRIGGSQNDGLNIEDQGNIQDGERTNSLIRNYGDWSRGEVILDAGNNIFVASCTQSIAPSDSFPIIGSVFQPVSGGGGTYHQDGLVLKITPDCNNMIFSSFLGGSDDDVAFVIDQSPTTGDIYIGGATFSTNFPGVGASALQKTPAGNVEGFVSMISNDGSTLKASTYIGTTGNDVIYGVKFDRFGFPYVMGTTTGQWPVINASWSNAGARQFVSKLKPDLSAFVYSTTFGTPGAASPNISPVAFLVDRCQNVYISGWGSFYAVENPDPYGLQGTTGMPVTPDAYQAATDGRDFYFIVIKRDATGQLYGTFFGQKDSPDASLSLSEHVDGGTSRFDKDGVIYQAICANCYTVPSIKWPSSPNTWSPCNGTSDNCTIQGACNLAVVKIRFNFAGVTANIKSLINGQYDSVGCVPLAVTLEDTIRNAKTYVWSFGDGTPDTTTTNYSVLHTYSSTGTYLVRLIAIDSATCNISDTAYLHITARNDKAILGLNIVKQQPCQALSYQFINNSIPPAGKPFTANSFVWDFGDGTIVTAGTATQTHSYAAPGTYNVKLLLIDTNYCNYPDSIVQPLSVSPLVKAQFQTPPAGCAPYTAVFTNTSLAGQQFFWDFGDGSTSTDVNPTHQYVNVGSYTIRLTVIDSNTCNIIDSTKTTIIVSDKPHAALTTTPVPPVANTPNVFYNSSTGAVLFKWFFGDGDSTTRTTTDTVIHQYNKTGTFNACLIAYNQYGCADRACLPVDVIVNPLFDVPNAFTPGRFGDNSIVKVRGFGISKLMFRIYNRWGQKIFESNDQNIGWDGTFKGAPQPVDVYAYVVEVEFFDGKRATKKGDITLIR
ncbi:MAG TPA: PKD domain-containing protein [Puia sp.]|nr:PKD domain-containing protein [Puia sp.]